MSSFTGAVVRVSSGRIHEITIGGRVLKEATSPSRNRQHFAVLGGPEMSLQKTSEQAMS